MPKASQDASGDADAKAAPAKAPKRWVDMSHGEPVVTNGRGMHFMAFMPAGGFRTIPIVPAARPASSSTAPLSPEAPVAKFDESPQAVPVGPHGSIRGPSKWKSGRAVFEHGNYAEYYGYRLANPEREEEPRLVALRARFGNEVFLGKEVLDVGCNAGLVSLAVAGSFGAKRVVGVDIDANLIDQAQANLKAHSLREGSPAGSVEFRAEDILQSPMKRGPEMKTERFDAVLALSVTKWIHMHHGDEGIKRFFSRIVKRLKPGGLLVLEPQEWSSYTKKRHLTRDIREVVRGIQMRPEAFKDHLVSLGLEPAGKIKPKGDVIKGFHRPMRLFRKPAADEDVGVQCSAEPVEGNDARPKKKRKATE